MTDIKAGDIVRTIKANYKDNVGIEFVVKTSGDGYITGTIISVPKSSDYVRGCLIVWQEGWLEVIEGVLPRKIDYSEVRVGDKIQAVIRYTDVTLTREGVVGVVTEDGIFTESSKHLAYVSGGNYEITLLERPKTPKAADYVIGTVLKSGHHVLVKILDDSWSTYQIDRSVADEINDTAVDMLMGIGYTVLTDPTK